MANHLWFQYGDYMNNKLASLQAAQPDAGWTIGKEVDAFEKAGYSGEEGAYQHFLQWGHKEDVSPNNLFNADYYYKSKAYQFYALEENGGLSQDQITENLELYAANMKTAMAKAGLDAWTHYIMYGTSEGINPSEHFNTAKYMQMKLDALQADDPEGGWTADSMYEAFKKCGFNALSHAYAYGTDDTTATKAECHCWTDSSHTALIEVLTTNDDPIVDPEDNPEGQTFALTHQTDILEGTKGDDKFIADNSGGNHYLSEADTVDGKEGNDTLTIYQNANTDLGSTPFGQLSNVETIDIKKGSLNDGSTMDSSNLSGVTDLSVEEATAVEAARFTFNMNNDQTLHLTKLHTGGFHQTVAVSGAKAIVLNEVANKGADTALTLDIISNESELVLTAEGDTKLEIENSRGKINDLVIAGEGHAEVTANLDSVTNVDASGSNGGVSLDMSAIELARNFSFAGGAGNDTLHISDSSLARLSKGSQLDGGDGENTLIVDETETLNASEISRVNDLSNFQTLGFGASGSGVNVSKISDIHNFLVGKGDLNATFTEASADDRFIIDNSEGNSGIVTIANTLGEKGTSIDLVNSSSKGHELATLTLDGISTVAMSSTGKGANNIGTFNNTDNTTITLTGNSDLSIELQAAATIGSTIDASGFTGSLTATSSGLGGILIGGSKNDFLTARAEDGALTGNEGNDTFHVAASVFGAEGKFVTITDFTAGKDMLVLADHGEATFNEAPVSTTAATTAAEAISMIAGKTDGSTDAVVRWGQYDGNTYIVEVMNNDAGVVSASDVVVKLSGLVDLSELVIGEDIIFA